MSDTAAKTVDEYLASLSPYYRETLENLRQIIKSVVPLAEEKISYGIPSYKFNGPLVHFMAHPRHCSFITADKMIGKTFKEELKGYKVSGTTIHFTPEKPLAEEVIRKIILHRIEQNNAKEKKMPIISNSPKIYPCLWFDNNAEEAVEFYTSIFKDSKIINLARFPENSMGLPGAVMDIEFLLEGHKFMALNGGPYFNFTPAISFIVNCENQQEIDYLWDKLSEGGKIEQCGWLKDKFGISWQIIPASLEKLLLEADPEKYQRVMDALLKMIKIDIAALENA